MCFRGQGGHGDRTASAGTGCSGSGRNGSANFCYDIGIYMLWSRWRKYLTGWDGWRSRIVVVGTEECCDIIGGFIRSLQKFFVMCRNVDNIIGSCVLEILTGFIQLGVNCVGCI